MKLRRRRTSPTRSTPRYKVGTTKRGEIRLWIPQATPDKAFRILVTLVRDQEVDGSNPFAPTTSLVNQQFTGTQRVVERLVVAYAFFFRSAARDQSFSSEFSVLRCEVRHTASLGLGKLSTRSRFWKKNQTASSSPVPCTVKATPVGSPRKFPRCVFTRT